MLLTYFLKSLRFLIMRVCLALILLIVSGSANVGAASRPLVIAVIDTGFGYKDRGHSAHLCSYGHKDFSIEGQSTKNYATYHPVPLDTHSHGTNVVGLIERELAGYSNYCIVILKFYSDSQTGYQNAWRSALAFIYAANIKVDVINYSGGGPEINESEQRAVQNFLKSGGTIVAAAGNEKMNLDIKENSYYPAGYDDRIIVVGNIDGQGNRVPSSNFGNRVNRVENGFEQEAYEIKLTGTSQATAVATGKIARGMLDVRK